MESDRHVVQCNYTEGTGVAPEGARAYVATGSENVGNGYERIVVLVRSRSGRWVRKWEHRRRLTDFRVKTLPPEHPLYADSRLRSASSCAPLLKAMAS